jgi:hypothetical protein
MQHYTYAHYRESDNRVFYIGKGVKRRAWACTKGSRGQHWLRAKEKHGFRVEILARWATKDEAFEHEKFLISTFRDMGHPLVNKTNGGEGSLGLKMDKAQLERHAKRVEDQWARPDAPIRAATTSAEFCAKMVGVNREIGMRPEQRVFRSEVALRNWSTKRKQIVAAIKTTLAEPAKRARKLECIAVLTKIKMKPIVCVETGQRFESIKAALLHMGKKPTQTGITKCVIGLNKTAYGLTWKFLKEE